MTSVCNTTKMFQFRVPFIDKHASVFLISSNPYPTSVTVTVGISAKIFAMAGTGKKPLTTQNSY